MFNAKNGHLSGLKQLLLISFVLLSIASFGQNSCPKCDIETVKEIRLHRDNLTDEIVFKFLCSFDESCLDYAEYSQASNGTIFDLLDIATDLFIRVLDSDNVNVKQILTKIEDPIDDGIDLQLCYDRVAKLDKSTKYRAEVLAALDLAAERSGLKIRK